MALIIDIVAAAVVIDDETTIAAVVDLENEHCNQPSHSSPKESVSPRGDY